METQINLSKLAKHFYDGDSARALMESIRWPNGPVCPLCQSTEAYRLRPKPESRRPGRRGLLKCKACRKQFTVTVGSIFEDSHIPLSKWLLAIHLLCSSKKGMSAYQLHPILGITYKSAWFMAQRIRHALSQPPLVNKLKGVVEGDKTYIGGKAHGQRGRRAEKKTPYFHQWREKGVLIPGGLARPRLTGPPIPGQGGRFSRRCGCRSGSAPTDPGSGCSSDAGSRTGSG